MADTQGRTDRMVASVEHVFSWFSDGSWERHHLDPGIADFTFGNPQELPLPGLVDALQRNAVPQDKDWFAYKMSEEEPRSVVAESLRRRTGIAFGAEDVAMTAGAFGALGVTIRALCDVGDEVIFLSPPWFFYELMIASAGATAVRVRPRRAGFDLDVDAIAAAITPRTRAIIVNTPHNPTGRIYREPELPALGDVLRAASERHGRPIVLLSDESYNRIVFDGIEFRTPALDYDATAPIYTYGKTTAGARPADRLRGPPPVVPGPSDGRLPDLRPPARRRLGLPQRAAPARDPRPRDAVDRHRRAPGAPRPDGAGAARDGLRGDAARGHVLPHGPLARPRRPRVHGPPRRARRARAARARSSRSPAGSGSRSRPATRWSSAASRRSGPRSAGAAPAIAGG